MKSEKQRLHLEKLKLLRLGFHFTEATKKKMSEAHKGKRFTIETKLKMSIGRTGKKNAFYGHRHLIETKQKISKANKGRLTGKKNPNWQNATMRFICKKCGKLFLIGRYKLKKQRGFFCSRKCYFEYKTQYKMSDVQKRIQRNMRASINHYIRNKCKNKWEAILGYTAEQLLKHLKRKFLPKMCWDNYGEKWHIDHIIPASNFKFDSIHDEQVRECWSLKNLRPFWIKDNIRKSNKGQIILI